MTSSIGNARGMVPWHRLAFTAVLASSLVQAANAIGGGGRHQEDSAAVSVFAMGLNNPRGLKFGPDGNLYVAEGGAGGSNSTAGQCTQVVPPVGPYTGSATGGRISKIDGNGARTTVIDTIPSSQTSAALGSLVSGAADVAFIGTTLYALVNGAGCSHGVPNTKNGIYRISGGNATLVADLSTYQMAHPVANPSPGDFEPDGTWYSMIATGGNLYAVEPNHGELDRITPSGQITRIADLSTLGHLVPTALAWHGDFYVGNLGVFPLVDGASSIHRITPAGQVKEVAAGLTAVLGVAFDRNGRMYVLENTTGNPFPTPFTGRVVRVSRDGDDPEVIVGGLFLPTAMTFGPDGNLYVSNSGFGPLAVGLGHVLRIRID